MYGNDVQYTHARDTRALNPEIDNMAKILSYSSIGIMLAGLLTIGAYIVGATDDVRNLACGMQAVIVGAFCFAIANDR